MSHTPGPWRTEDEGYDIVDEGWTILAGEPGSTAEHAVAYIYGNKPADARLISASPDLLKACEGIAKALEDGVLVRDIRGDMDPAWAVKYLPLVITIKTMMDAIAKARGES